LELSGEGEKKEEKPKYSSELKLITRLCPKAILENKFYTGKDKKEYLRFWFNLGEHDIGQKVHLWSKLKTTKDFN